MSYEILKAEFDGDPLGLGYAAMDDAARQTSINAFTRDAPPVPGTMLTYLALERYRGETLLGRLTVVARASDGDVLPLGTGVGTVTMTFQHIASAVSLLAYVDPARTAPVPLSDARFDTILDDLAGGAGNAEAIGPADKTALAALSINQQSRGMEIGAGANVRLGAIAEARN